MVQIKLSVAFILAAAAIAPIVAVPVVREQTRTSGIDSEPKPEAILTEAGSNAAPVATGSVVPQHNMAEPKAGVANEPLPGPGVRTTSEGTNTGNRKLGGKHHKHTGKKGHKGLKHKNGRKHKKDHKHKTLIGRKHKKGSHAAHKAKVHSQENADQISARDDSAEKVERSLDDADLASDLAARDESEMFGRSFDDLEYEAREDDDLD